MSFGEKTIDWRQQPDRLGDGRKKKNKSGEDTYVTELLKLAMETEEAEAIRKESFLTVHTLR